MPEVKRTMFKIRMNCLIFITIKNCQTINTADVYECADANEHECETAGNIVQMIIIDELTFSAKLIKKDQINRNSTFE